MKTKFSVKLRSADMYFQSNNLLKLLEIVNSSSSSYLKKIIIPFNMAIFQIKFYIQLEVFH